MTNRKLIFYVGTYTDPPARGAGILTCLLDCESGELSVLSSTSDVINPSYLAVSQSGLLFAVEEARRLYDGTSGAISSFAVESSSGRLRKLSQVRAPELPCYVALHPNGRFLFEASYRAGSVSMYRVGADGALQEACATVQHVGRSVDPIRQVGPRAHASVVDPTGRYLLVPDLGIDQVITYAIDVGAGLLTRVATTTLPAGSGPRHLVFHPNGRHAYLINELSSTVAAYRFDARDGALEQLQSLSVLPAGFGAANQSADIHVRPDGRFLYASNRGHDSLACFAVDGGTGLLTAAGHFSSGGAWPRGFGVSPDGKWVVAANQNGGGLAALRINPTTGALAQHGPGLAVESPVCVVFAASHSRSLT